MRKPTPEQRAHWPEPNFENPEQLQSPVIAATSVTFFLAVLFLTTRIVGKRILRQRLEADDYLMLAAMTVAIPTSIFPLVCLNLGLGLHVWDQKPEWYTLYAKLGFASDLLFPTACSLTKVSQCLSYRRVFPGRPNQIFCHVMIVLLTTYALTCVVVSLLECRPIRAHWSTEPGLECVNARATLVAMAALNSITDLLVFLRPATPLLARHMPARPLVVAIGLFPCTAGLLRVYYLAALHDSIDEPWNASIIQSLTTTQLNLGLSAVCVTPALPLLVPRLFASAYPPANGKHRVTPAEGQTFALPPLRPGRASCSGDAFEALWTPEGTGSHYASASSAGRRKGVKMAPGVIAVEKAFVVREEAVEARVGGEVDVEWVKE